MPTKSFAHYTGRAIPCLLQTRKRITGLAIPAHEAMQEVTHMDKNTTRMTATNPSRFGMPICGHTDEMSFAGAGATTVVRDRQAVLKGDMGVVPAYTWGPPAWSPPNS